MYRFLELRTRLVTTATLALFASIMLVLVTDAQEALYIPKIVTPQGVRLLENKTFDDSDHARKEILDVC